MYIQEWNEKVNVSSKGKQCTLYKDNLNFEKYLIRVSKFYYDKIIIYRTGNHRLPTETGRWDDTPLNDENVMFAIKTILVMSIIICFHVTFFKNERKLYLKPYFYVNSNICKYRELFTSNSETTLIKLSKFVEIIMQKFSSYFFISKRLRRKIIPANIKLKFHFYCDYMFIICHLSHIF